MTTISANALIAPDLSGLTARGDTASTGVLLHWDTPIDNLLWATELWVSTTNDRATASLYKTVTGNSVLYLNSPGVTYYFWIRSVSVYGKSNGSWYPSNPTAGVSSNISLITLADIAPNTVSLNYFSFDLASYAGAGGAFYASVMTLNVNNTSPDWLPMSFTYTCKQSYSGAAVNTMWKLFNNTTGLNLIDLGTFTDKLPLLTLATVFLVPPNTFYNLTLYWYGANSTVSRSNGSLQLFGLKL